MNGLLRNLWAIVKSVKDRRRRRTSRAFRPVRGVERFEERTLLSVALVSVNGAGTAGADSSSTFGDPGSSGVTSAPTGNASTALSSDGSLMVFQSDANDLVAGSTVSNQATNVFDRNLATGQSQLVSATPDGSVANGRSFDPVISPNGRYVAFLSTATNLSTTPANPPSAGAANGTGLLYVRDLQTGTTTLLDATPNGQAGNGLASDGFVFSPDSTELAFADSSTNLTSTPSSAGTPGVVTENVYLRNLAAGTTTPVSVTPGGTLSSGNATQPVFSPDGSSLAFLSTANDLTGSGQGGAASASTNAELYLRNLAAGTTTAVSVTPGNGLSAGTITQAVFSPNSQLLAFVSTGTDLTTNPSDTPLAASGPGLPQWYASNVYVRNLATGATTAASVTPSGQLSNGFVGDPSFTPDSQSLAYLSSANDLTSNATPPTSDTAPADTFPSPLPNAPATPPANLFLTNLLTGLSTLVSVTPTGTLSSGNVVSYAISPDGTKVAFDAVATDLTSNPPTISAAPATVAASSSVVDNVFVRDLTGATTTLISAAPGGTLSSDPAFDGSEPLVFSPDNQTLYFGTSAALVANDTNNTNDIYAAAAPFATPDAIQFATWQFDANTGSGQAVITVVRNSPFDTPASVDYSEQDVSTRAGSDYVATSGTLNFAAGQASATFTIPLNASDSFSGTRSATISLANPSGGPLGFPTATLNLTGVLPVVPVTISAPATPAKPAHPQLHPHAAKAKPTASPSATTPTVTPKPAATTTVTVYTAPVPTTSAAGDTPAAVTTGSSTSSSTSDTSTPTSTPTAAGTTVPTTSTTAASTAGPIVTSLALRSTRHRITSVIINFSTPIAGTAANNIANYGVHLVTQGRRSKQGVRITSVGRAVGISSATSDSSGDTVTLTLSTPLRSGQMFQLRVNGGTSGITDQGGNSLNSPSAGTPGSDFEHNVN